MSEEQILDYTKFNFDNLVYNKPRKERGKYLGKVKYKIPGQKTHDTIIIKTPRLKCLSELKISDDRCILELELSNNNIDYYQFLINFDDKNVTTAYINSKHWFGQQFPMDIIDEFYKPVIKMSRNKNPSIKARIVYEELKNFDLDILKKDKELVLLLECMGLRFLNQQFTMFWKIIQAKEVDEEGDGDYYEKGLINDISDTLSTDEDETQISELEKRFGKVLETKEDIEIINPDDLENVKIVQKTLDEPVQESVKEQVQESVKEPVQESVKEPVQESVKESVKEPVQELVKESVKESVKEKVKESVQESVQEPVNEHIQETVKEPVKESVQESVKEPVKESVKESVQESVQEPVQEPIELKENLLDEKNSRKHNLKKKMIKYANNRTRIWK